MTTITTTRRIDLAQLDTEVGSPGLNMVGDPDSDGPKEITAPDTVTAASLQAAVDAHVWVDRAANDATLRQQARDSLTTLRTSVDALKTITDKANNQVGPADTKAVARETRRVARQVLALTRIVIEALETADTGTD